MLFGKRVERLLCISQCWELGMDFFFFFKWVRVPTFVAHGLILETNIGWEDAVKSWEHTGGARTTRAFLEIWCFWAECRGWVALARRAFIQAFASIPFSFPSSFFHFSFGCFQFPQPPTVAQHVFSSHPVSLQLFLFFRTFPHGGLYTQPPSRKQQRTQHKLAPWQKDRFPLW